MTRNQNNLFSDFKGNLFQIIIVQFIDFLYTSKYATNHNNHVGGQFSSIHSFEYAVLFLQCENFLPLNYLCTRVDNYQNNPLFS